MNIKGICGSALAVIVGAARIAGGVISNTYVLCQDALKLKIGRMIESMLTVSPILAIISSAGL